MALLTLSRYTLHEEIATGGMATVYLGRLKGPAGFSRTVAIKKLHAQYAKDPEFAAMFLDEVRLVSRIQHPNVVQPLDVVAEDDNILLVMEFVRGEPLSTLVRLARQSDTPMPPAIVSAIGCGMLEGLYAAHQACDEEGHALHIIHRDVSPQNVVIGIDGTARVLDFGVAKAARRVQVTREGQLKGKISYMAPEQLEGAEASEQSDIYSVGVVLWQALTLKHPFSGNSDAERVRRIMSDVVSPPSELVASIPPALDAVIMRALSREPGARFKSAREMALALAEAVRPATAPDVAAWIEQLAPESINRVRSQIKRMESDPNLAAQDETLTSPSLASSSREGLMAPPPSRSRTMIAIGVALVGVIGAVAFMRPATHPPADPTPAGATSVTMPHVTPTATASASASTAESPASASAPASAAPSASASAAPSAAPASAPRPSARAAAPPRPTSSKESPNKTAPAPTSAPGRMDGLIDSRR